MNIKKLIKEGKKFEEKGKFGDAFGKYLEATKKDEKSKDAWNALAHLYLKGKDSEKGPDTKELQNSLNAIMKVIEIDPKDEEAWIQFGRICAKLDQWGKVERAFETAFKIKEPDNPELLSELAESYEHQEKWDKMTETFQKVVQINPNDINAWNGIGKANMQLFKWNDAVSAFERSLHLENKENYTAWYLLGISRNYTEDFSGAAEALDRALRLRPKLATIWEKLGMTFVNWQKKEEALYCYEKAVEYGDIISKDMAKGLKDEGLTPKKPVILKDLSE